jgi:uncharacterized protein YecE (DUF72 family)
MVTRKVISHKVYCIHDMHPLKILIRITAPSVYIHFHGDPARSGDYPRATLETWAKCIEDWRCRKPGIFVHFAIGGYARTGLMMLRRLLMGSGVESEFHLFR